MARKSLKLFISLVLLSSATAVTSSLAWFSNKAEIGPGTQKLPIESGSESGYFAYGNGETEETAYGIRTPRQLYNLAWLQYLGYLGLDKEQLYFELADDVDMSGWTLPPIGTETFPFIGQFDGQGYVVSNLTVSNKFADYEGIHPGVVNSSNFTAPHILGMFGVVGNYNGNVSDYSSATNQLINTGILNATIKSNVSNSLMGIAAGYVDATMSNVAVESGTINVGSSAATAYIPTGKTDPITSNISDYSLVGYTTNKTTITKTTNTIYDIDIQKPQEFVATTQGAINGWGGSIDMTSVYNRLTDLRPGTATNDVPYAVTRTELDGATVNEDVVTDEIDLYRHSGASGSNYSGNINYMTGHTTDHKHYLVGGKYVTKTKYETNSSFKITDGTNYLRLNGTTLENSTNSGSATNWSITYTNDAKTTCKIYSTTSNYYLVYNNSRQLSATTNAAQASTFDISFNFDQNLAFLSATINNQGYGLSFYNDSWGLNGTYQITDATDASYFIPASIRNNNSNNNRTFAAATSPEVTAFNEPLDGERVSFEYNNTTYYLRLYRSRNNNYYISASNSETLGTNYYAVNYYVTGGGIVYLRAQYNTNTFYYLYFNGSNCTCSTTQTRVYTALYPMAISNTITHQVQAGESDSHMEFTAEDTSYFPIEADTNNNATDKNVGYFVGGSTNTTHTNSRSLVFSHYETNRIIKGLTTTDGTRSLSDSNVYTIDSSGITAMNTMSAADFKANGKFAKYKRTMKSFTNKALQNDRMGGFHFYANKATMGFISKDSIVNATNVRITNEVTTNITKANYELPVYSLDFKLLEQGRINFLAGLYNGGYGTNSYGTINDDDRVNRHNHMNGFFSFHKVFRDEDEKITDIKEIKAIYSLGGQDSYIYSYVDGNNIIDENNNSFSAPTGATLLFDTTWIGHRYLDSQAGSVFYFEIPVDAGEYCLGGYRLTGPTATPSSGTTATSADGAYLMYLDIGANAARTTRTAIAEHFAEIIVTTSYPNGVALIQTSTVATNLEGNNTNIDYSNSACAVIMAGYVGSISVQRTSATSISVPRAASYRDYAKPSYISDTITSVVDPGYEGDLKKTAFERKVEKETYRIQFYDFNVKENELIVTQIVDTREKAYNATNWGNFTRHIFQTDIDENTGDTYFAEVTSSNAEVYLVFRYDGEEGDYNGDPWTFEEAMNLNTTLYYDGENSLKVADICCTLETPLVIVYYKSDSVTGAVEDLQIILNMITDGSLSVTGADQYYSFGNYTITPTISSGGSVIFKIESLDGNTTIILGTTTLTPTTEEVTISNP